MEAQIKDECEEASICTSGDLASLTLIEKYDRFLLGHDKETDADSDGGLFSDATLKEEYNLMRRTIVDYMRSGRKQSQSQRQQKLLGQSFIEKEKVESLIDSDISIDVENSTSTPIPTTETITTISKTSPNRNGSSRFTTKFTSTTGKLESKTDPTSTDVIPDLTSFDKLIDQLHKIRSKDTNWRTLKYDEEEYNKISQIYAQMLEIIENKSRLFEKANHSKDQDQQQQNVDVEVEKNTDADDHEDVDDVVVDAINDDVEVRVDDYSVDNEITQFKKDDKKLLAEEIEKVRSTRDRFYEVEQQVREYIEQLELVERYKMESVG